MRKIIILLIMLIAMATCVLAVQPTQQYNRLYLDPFYRESLVQNIENNYTITIQPPDGISTVKSAIITFDAYINPSRTFSLTVNGGACNNPTYTISTTYAGAGRAMLYFDCSNRITKAGTYKLGLRVTSGNIGAISGWLDLTYMNKALDLEVFGTEYQVGDSGKLFIQLVEGGLTPINNASCYATIYYPGGTKWYTNTLMTYQNDSNGLYYFDFTAPLTTGIYMTEVYCEYYTSVRSTNATGYVIVNGTYYSGTGASITVIDSDYLVVAERNYNTGYYSADVNTSLLAHLDEYNGTASIDSSVSGGTGTHTNGVITNITGVSGAGAKYDGINDYTIYPTKTALNLGATEHLMVCLSFNESVSNANGNRLVDSIVTEGFRISFDGGNDIRWVTDRSGSGAQTIDTPLTYLDSQWHTMCGYANLTNMIIYIDGASVITAAKAQSGTMTMGAVTIGAVSGGGGNWANVAIDELCIMKGTFTSTTPSSLATAYNTNKQCGTPQNVLEMNITIPSVSILSDYVNYNIITRYTYDEIGENIDVYVYNYTGNTWYKLANSLTYSLTETTVSTQLTMNISQFLNAGVMTIRYVDTNQTGGSVGVLRINQVRLDQTNYVDVPITAIRGSAELHITTHLLDMPLNVWTYINRTLTAYPNLTTSINITAISEDVWNYTTRNLTYYEHVDMTNYTRIDDTIYAVNESLYGLITSTWLNTTLEIGLIQSRVWEYNTRNLTYYPTQLDLTNYSLINEGVWLYNNRTLTYYPTQLDLTNYSLINEGVWSYNTRNLTYYEHVDMTNYTTVAVNVWTYTTRNLTYYPPTTTAQEIWEYTTRNLTYYPAQLDLTNYSLINEGVWSYNVRNLTYYEDKTNYTQIIDTVPTGVWTYVTRNLTYYPDTVNASAISDNVWNYAARYTHGVVLN